MWRPIFEKKLLNLSAISVLSVYVWLFILNESGKDDLSFIFPIAYFSIDQHFLELFFIFFQICFEVIFFHFPFQLVEDTIIYFIFVDIFYGGFS